VVVEVEDDVDVSGIAAEKTINRKTTAKICCKLFFNF
jgi:hypothetical protein